MSWVAEVVSICFNGIFPLHRIGQTCLTLYCSWWSFLLLLGKMFGALQLQIQTLLLRYFLIHTWALSTAVADCFGDNEGQHCNRHKQQWRICPGLAFEFQYAAFSHCRDTKLLQEVAGECESMDCSSKQETVGNITWVFRQGVTWGHSAGTIMELWWSYGNNFMDIVNIAPALSDQSVLCSGLHHLLIVLQLVCYDSVQVDPHPKTELTRVRFKYVKQVL